MGNTNGFPNLLDSNAKNKCLREKRKMLIFIDI